MDNDKPHMGERKKLRGRPRKQGIKSENPRESILATAIKLFQERGYAKTSLSEIARQNGMDQSSLYYWFPSKEAILESIFDRNKLAPIPRIIHNREINEPYVIQLYLLIVSDVVTKCDLPFDFIELEGVAHQHPERFEYLFKDYRNRYQTMLRVLQEGIDVQEFIPCEADERVVTILSVNEGLQHHYHAKKRGELILEASGYTVSNYTPESIGFLSAQTILPSLATEPLDLLAIRARAQEIVKNLSGAEF